MTPTEINRAIYEASAAAQSMDNLIYRLKFDNRHDSVIQKMEICREDVEAIIGDLESELSNAQK